jgi:hypothetical protein
MGGISGTQIKNLSEMLELHAKATTRTQEMQQAQEQQRFKLEQALRDVETAGKQKNSIEVEFKEIQDKVLRDKAELDRLDTVLKEGRRNLTDSAVQVNAVREKLLELAKAVRNNDPGALRVATEVLKENSNPIEIKPEKLDANVLKALIGRSDADTIADLSKSAAFVVRRKDNFRRGEAAGKSNDSIILAGKPPTGSIFRDVTQLGSDGSRILSAAVASIFGTVTPDEDDWYSTRKYVVLHSEYSSSGSTLPKDKERWSAEDVPGNDVIKDYPNKVAFLSLDQLRNEAPDLFDYFKSSSFGELQYGMYERAKNFSGASLLSTQNAGALSGMPSDLGDVLIRLVDAAVKRQIDDGARFVSSPSPAVALLGQLAAIVLHPDFEFTQYTSSSPDITLLAGHFDYKIRGFRKYGFAQERVATFRFIRARGGGWLLEQITVVGKDPGSTPR